MSIKQWVNLPTEESRKSKFVEGKVEAAKRVGPELKVIVEFKDASLATFKWKVTKVEGTGYKPTEVGNNKRFAGFFRASSTNAEKKKIEDAVDVTLPVSGGAKYKVEVKHKDKLIGTKEIETRRRIYYRPFKMKGLRASGGDVSAVLDDMKTRLWTEAKKFYIDALQKGEATIDDVHTVDFAVTTGPESTDAVTAAAKAAYGDFKDFEPVGIPIVIGKSAAERKMKTFYFDRTLPRPPRIDSPINQVIAFDLPGCYLWKDLVPRHDAKNGGLGVWFIEGKMMVSEAKTIHYTCPIDRAEVLVAGSKRGPYGGHSRVHIFADPKFLARHVGKKASLSLKLYIVDGFTNGYSSNSVNLIALMTETWWSPRTVDAMKQTMLHEIGHKIGMVADGLAGSPEKPDVGHFYGGKGKKEFGHTGRHCKNGTSPVKGVLSGTPKCVMFGAAAKGRPNDFCDACEKVVPKLDVSGDLFEKPVRNA